jgi:predicted nucleotide-binding protein
VASVEVQRIRVAPSAESAEGFRPVVEQQLRSSSVVTLGGPSMAWLLAARGRDVTDALISGPPGYAIDQENPQLGGSEQPLAVAAGAGGPGDRRSVFLVHGRDASAAAAMRDLLRAFGLRIIEWEHALQHLDQGPSPYVGDIVMAGMRLADAVVVLATPDDLVSLRQDLTDDGDEETTIQGQARPNVIYEAGIADALDRTRTLLVEVGRVKGLSDLGGRNTVRFNGSSESRRQLASRLRGAKLDVDDMGVSWLSAGDFDASLKAARAALTAVPSWTPIPPAQTEPTAGDEELFTFMDAWARPAFEAAKTLLGLAKDALRGQDDLAKRDLAVLYQRVDDDADRAYSLAFNASEGLEGAPSPQAAVGDFHRHYQGMVTWIGKGCEHAVLDPDSFWYREWHESDTRFMDELRRTAAHPGRSALRENLRAAGFNEGVRHQLPAPGPRG